MPEKKLALLVARIDEPVSLYDSDENGTALVDMLVDASAGDPVASSEQIALAAIFQKMLSEFEPRAAELLTLRFGLDGGEPKTLAEAGEHFGFTRERARQIEAGALKKLSHPSRAKILCEFLEGYSAGRHCPSAEVQVDVVEPDVEAQPKRDRQRISKKNAAEPFAKSNECSNDGSVDKVEDDAIATVLEVARAAGAEVKDGRQQGGKIVVRLRWNGPPTRLLIRALLENGFKPYPGMEYRK
jgi:RNA polymerase primary sigma factor